MPARSWKLIHGEKTESGPPADFPHSPRLPVTVSTALVTSSLFVLCLGLLQLSPLSVLNSWIDDVLLSIDLLFSVCPFTFACYMLNTVALRNQFYSYLDHSPNHNTKCDDL